MHAGVGGVQAPHRPLQHVPGTSTRDVTNVTKVVLSQRAPAADYRHGHSAHATPGTPTPSLVHHLVTRPPVQLSTMNVEACVPVHRCAEPAVSNLACAGRAAAPPHTCSVVERPGWCLAPAPSYLQSESPLPSASTAHNKHIIISSYRHITSRQDTQQRRLGTLQTISHGRPCPQKYVPVYKASVAPL